MSELRCTIHYFVYRTCCLAWLGGLSSKHPRLDSMAWVVRLFNSMSPSLSQSSKLPKERLANVAIRHQLRLKCRRWGSRLDAPQSIEARLASNSKSDVEDDSGFFTANSFPTLPSRGKAREAIKEFGECAIGVIAGLCFGRPSYKKGDKKDKKQPKYLTVNTPDLRKNSGSDTVQDVGIYTCYHAAHHNAWNKHATSNRAAILCAGGDEQGEPAMAAKPEIVVQRTRKSRRISNF